MEFMLFRKFLPLFAAFVSVCPVAAHAQFGLYGTVTGERLTGFTCLDPTGQCAATSGVVDPFGGTFGGYFDFRNVGPVRLGVDLRGDVLSANKSAQSYQASGGLIRHYAALGGVRASFATPIKYIRPYGEVAFGYAKTNAAGYSTLTGLSSYSNYTQVEGLLGIDVPVLPYVDLRAIEFGAGAIFGSSTHSLQSIGAGVVFHAARP